MQNTMLDSTVSNSLRDNSSVEYVAPETNPLTTIQTEPKNLASVNQLFDFHAVHNGEACIESLDPKDRGTERQFRFTRALLCTLLGVKSQDTITNHVDKLLKRGVIEVTKNLVTLKIPSHLSGCDVRMCRLSLTKSRSIVRFFGLCDSLFYQPLVSYLKLVASLPTHNCFQNGNSCQTP